MIRFNSSLELDNGAIATHFIIGMVSINDKKIDIVIDAFSNKECADKALERYSLLNSQQEKISEFNSILEGKTEISEENRTKLNTLQQEINDLSDQISSTLEYSSMVIFAKDIKLDYDEKLSEDFIKEQIKDSDIFKDKEIEFI